MQDVHAFREWTLPASPQALWPYVADTSRRNYEGGNPPLASLLPPGQRLPNAFRLVQAGPAAFQERPFEWVRPQRFISFQRFTQLPIVAQVRVQIDLLPTSEGGTRLTCDVLARPTGWLTIPLAHWLAGRILNGLDASLAAYTPLAARQVISPLALPPAKAPRFAPGGLARLDEARQRLLVLGADPALAAKLQELLQSADDMTVGRIRPYALADYWGSERRAVLNLCLQATRAGLLEFHWELLCPLCRGAKESAPSLESLRTRVHCDTCNIDFEANFEWSVELVFNPPAAIRSSERNQYCVSGPQNTPHVVIQQLLEPGETRQLETALAPGRYRLRALELPGSQMVKMEDGGPAQAEWIIPAEAWPETALQLGSPAWLELHNAHPAQQLLILERLAWSDQAVTAAEVFASQAFRDLFTREVLRPGEQVAVGHQALVFTDLCDSTQLYDQVGDAVAFGLVLEHFDLLKAAMEAEGGAVVKTIGDSVMAVFQRPAQALRAVITARRKLAETPGAARLRLKAGIHYGPCIAVTLNERLDYFGATVNLAARLDAQAPQGGVVLSQVVAADPETSEYLRQAAIELQPLEAELKGFKGRFHLWKIEDRPSGG